jgi:hypothetical protein
MTITELLLLLFQHFSFGLLLRITHCQPHQDHARRSQRRQENSTEPRRQLLVLLLTRTRRSSSLLRSGCGSGGGTGGLTLLLFGVFVLEGAFEAFFTVALLVGWVRDSSFLPQLRIDRTDIVLLRRTGQPTHDRPEKQSHTHLLIGKTHRCLTSRTLRNRRLPSKNLPWTRPADLRCAHHYHGPCLTLYRFHRLCCDLARRRP